MDCLCFFMARIVCHNGSLLSRDIYPVLHVFAIYSLLFGDWMYNAASVLMRHLSRNAPFVTAPASLTNRNSNLTALPDTCCAGMDQTRSGTHGGRENGKRPGR